jgi:(2S)-methylsuccinyl-CoA dehydrogenase
MTRILATYAATLRELANFAGRLEAEGKFGETEQLTVQIAAGEYVNHVAGGIPMNQGEFLRLPELGLTRSETAGLHDLVLIERGNTSAARRRLVELIADGNFGSSGLDETLTEMGETMRRFVETKVAPHAHQWHLDNDYVPIEIVKELAELGVFALTLSRQELGAIMAQYGGEHNTVPAGHFIREFIKLGLDGRTTYGRPRSRPRLPLFQSLRLP